MSDTLNYWISRASAVFRGDHYNFLRDCRGIIHVGANVGQEAGRYASHGLSVVWIEPIPEVFAKLRDNISRFPNQTAINALISDVDGRPTTLHVSNNGGLSSSVLPLGQHVDVWPDVHFTSAIELTSETLPSALAKRSVRTSDFDALAIDTQGHELAVLRGAEHILHQFRYIHLEAADFPSYQGGAMLSELVEYLKGHHFSVKRKQRFARHPVKGSYFEVLFTRA